MLPISIAETTTTFQASSAVSGRAGKTLVLLLYSEAAFHLLPSDTKQHSSPEWLQSYQIWFPRTAAKYLLLDACPTMRYIALKSPLSIKPIARYCCRDLKRQSRYREIRQAPIVAERFNASNELVEVQRRLNGNFSWNRFRLWPPTLSVPLSWGPDTAVRTKGNKPC